MGCDGYDSGHREGEQHAGVCLGTLVLTWPKMRAAGSGEVPSTTVQHDHLHGILQPGIVAVCMLGIL